MSDKVYPVPAEWARRAWVDEAKYAEMYKRSVQDPAGFWGEIGKRLDWIKPYSKVKNTSFDPSNVSIKWYEDGTLNACVNCVDRHVARAATRSPSSGRATTPPRTRRSPIANCTSACASSPTCSRRSAPRRVIASRSICR